MIHWRRYDTRLRAWWSSNAWLGPTSSSSFLDNSFVPQDGTSRFLYEVWQPLILLALTFSFTIGFFGTLQPSTEAPSPLFCNVDGIIQELGPTDDYRPIWDPNLFFTVNIPYGRLSFTRAKVIDACWDIGIGRGGQLVASMMAYRVVRRSMTLTMEDSALLIPTATSMCCQQMQIAPLWELLCGVYIRPNKRPTPRSRSWLVGLARRLAYVFVCVYVLLFATLTSVMTGYRAGLTGYFGYVENQDSMMRPLENVTRPEFVLYNGTRVNLSDDRISAVSGMPLYETLKSYWATYARLVEEHYRLDLEWPTPFMMNQTCDTYHNNMCSLLLPAGAQGWEEIESNITVGDTMFRLPAPPLDVRNVSTWNANGFSLQQRIGQDFNSSVTNLWTYNGTVFDDKHVKESSRCIASDQYSWGFSSMLLLTFCIYTLLFSGALILLQAEVYWYSRSDRLRLSSSIYSDILFLSDAMQTRFGRGIWDISVKELDKKVRDHRGGISVDVDSLPCSRMAMRKLRKKEASVLNDIVVQGRTTKDTVKEAETSRRRLLPGIQLGSLELQSQNMTGKVLSSSQEAERSLTLVTSQSKSQVSHKDSSCDSNDEGAIDDVPLCSESRIQNSRCKGPQAPSVNVSNNEIPISRSQHTSTGEQSSPSQLQWP